MKEIKPYNAPIVLARKPLSEKSIVDNVIKHGTGGLNIDGCRVGTEKLPSVNGNVKNNGEIYGGGKGKNSNNYITPEREGRFPANLILDEEAGKILDEQSGDSKSAPRKKPKVNGRDEKSWMKFLNNGEESNYTDKGGASRFFKNIEHDDTCICKKQINNNMDNNEWEGWETRVPKKDNNVKLMLGDNMKSLKELPDNSIDSIVSDPPYGLSFMGKKWDYDVPSVDFWKEVLRVLKPGGHVVSFGGTRTYHRMVVNIEDAGFEIRDQIMWLYGCLSEDTEILTRRGWLKHNELKNEDDIMSWNSSKDILEFQQPSNINIKPFSGEMVSLKNKHTDQLLTTNHRVYAKHKRRKNIDTEYKVVEAGNMKKSGSYDLPLSSFHHGEGIGGVDYAKLLGWIWSDGTFNKDDSIRINQSSVNQPFVLEIDNLVNNLEIKHSRYERTRTYEYKYKGEQEYISYEWFFKMENKINEKIKKDLVDKKLTLDLIFNMSYEEKMAFLETAHHGDGGKDRTVIYQKDEEQQELLQLMFHITGRNSTINTKKVAINWRNKQTTQLQHAKLNKKEYYEGVVWCPTLDNGAFMAKRNGKIFLTGNSGFPKSHNIGKAYDKKMGNNREVVGVMQSTDADRKNIDITKNTSPYEGFGSALKPANEPICLARKPLSEKSIVDNVIKHGTEQVVLI